MSTSIKHIKKKFQFEVHFTDDQIQDIGNLYPYIPASEIPKTKPPKGQDCILITGKNIGIKAFHVNIGGLNYYIPEPDPISIYFHNAYVNYISISEQRKRVLDSLNQSNLNEDISKALYAFFGTTNGYVIFLFTAIEAFMNKFLPDNYIYKVVRSNRTELYNRNQIQRYLSFDEKLGKVLTEISGKSFEKAHPLKYVHIKNLKEFRDFIVHTKGDSKSSTPYDYIYKKALNFKYDETLLAVRDLLNYYQPNCVENCPCDENW
jgi:hypothetical protein